MLFYKGSGDIDVVFTDVIETVKNGDTLDINNNPEVGQTIANLMRNQELLLVLIQLTLYRLTHTMVLVLQMTQLCRDPLPGVNNKMT